MANRKWNPESFIGKGENPNGTTQVSTPGVNVDGRSDDDGGRRPRWSWENDGIDGRGGSQNPMQPPIDEDMSTQPAPTPVRRKR